LEHERTVDILEYIAQRIGCDYLSDLRYLNGRNRFRLSRELYRIPAEAFPLETWNDALDYLTGLPSEAKASEAKEKLIRYFAIKSLSDLSK
jgi:hypothetical protein